MSTNIYPRCSALIRSKKHLVSAADKQNAIEDGDRQQHYPDCIQQA